MIVVGHENPGAGRHCEGLEPLQGGDGVRPAVNEGDLRANASERIGDGLRQDDVPEGPVEGLPGVQESFADGLGSASGMNKGTIRDRAGESRASCSLQTSRARIGFRVKTPDMADISWMCSRASRSLAETGVPSRQGLPSVAT